MRILLGWRGKLYRFVSVESAERDGSLSVAIHQNAKTRHITLHQSGRINIKRAVTVFIEPLVTMTKAFGFYRYRIPKPSVLKEFEKERDVDDAVLELKDANEPTSFIFVISPKDGLPEFPGSVRLIYIDCFALTVAIEPDKWILPKEREGDFVHQWPTKGHFTKQQLPEDQALVEFHQIKHKMRGAVLYEPNKAGEWMLVFSVQMRIAPRVKIEMVDADLRVTDQDFVRDPRSERVMLRFKVRRAKTGEIIKTAAPIRSIELDSEL